MPSIGCAKLQKLLYDKNAKINCTIKSLHLELSVNLKICLIRYVLQIEHTKRVFVSFRDISRNIAAVLQLNLEAKNFAGRFLYMWLCIPLSIVKPNVFYQSTRKTLDDKSIQLSKRSSRVFFLRRSRGDGEKFKFAGSARTSKKKKIAIVLPLRPFNENEACHESHL